MIYYGCFPRGRYDNKDNKDKDKTMTKMMMTDDMEEAVKVEAMFNEVTKAIADGKEYSDADCYCDETNSFSDFTEDGVNIPYGTIVYVFRDIGGGEAVWDIYKFGECGKFEASKDHEGDTAGLVNAGFDWFPF